MVQDSSSLTGQLEFFEVAKGRIERPQATRVLEVSRIVLVVASIDLENSDSLR